MLRWVPSPRQNLLATLGMRPYCASAGAVMLAVLDSGAVPDERTKKEERARGWVGLMPAARKSQMYSSSKYRHRSVLPGTRYQVPGYRCTWYVI